MVTNPLTEKERYQLDSIIGKTIQSVNYENMNSGVYILTFTDGTTAWFSMLPRMVFNN